MFADINCSICYWFFSQIIHSLSKQSFFLSLSAILKLTSSITESMEQSFINHSSLIYESLELHVILYFWLMTLLCVKLTRKHCIILMLRQINCLTSPHQQFLHNTQSLFSLLSVPPLVFMGVDVKAWGRNLEQFMDKMAWWVCISRQTITV